MKKTNEKTKQAEETDISLDPKRAKRFCGDDFPEKKEPKKKSK